MAKPNFSDIIPPERRSVKRIPLHTREPERKVRIDRAREEELEERLERFEHPKERIERPRRRKGIRWRVIIALLVAVAITGGAFYFIGRVTSATIVLTPRSEDVAVDTTLVAYKNNSDTNGLSYHLVTISKDGAMAVPASGSETVEVKATGVIIIYNNLDTAQKLIASTRFQTKEGLIFRINQAVTIPPKKGSTPGSVEAVITADKAGADYNVGSKDFSIPGFATDPVKFEKVYGRSKTPVQGGFSGSRPKVDDAALASARAKIHDELRKNLLDQTMADIPEGYYMPNNAFVLTYESLPTTNSQGGAMINERAVLYGIMMSKSELAKMIADKTSTSGGPFDLGNGTSLTFSSNTASSTLGTVEKIGFALKGKAELVSQVDTAKLKSELVGKPRKNLSAILTSYPGIIKAEVTMRPFWQTDFPENPENITISAVSSPSDSPQKQ